MFCFFIYLPKIFTGKLGSLKSLVSSKNPKTNPDALKDRGIYGWVYGDPINYEYFELDVKKYKRVFPKLKNCKLRDYFLDDVVFVETKEDPKSTNKRCKKIKKNKKELIQNKSKSKSTENLEKTESIVIDDTEKEVSSGSIDSFSSFEESVI